MWRVSALDREGREIGHFEVADGEVTIGRETDRQLILPSASVSRRHAKLLVGNGQVQIMDEGSANGVVVDGVRIGGPTSVGPQSRIDLAEFRIVLAAPAPGTGSARGSSAGADVMKLVAEGGPYDGRVFPVGVGMLGVGRALENDLVFDDPSLSRKHAQLTRIAGGRLLIEDLGSSNGTFVNGKKVQRGEMAPGEALQFGDLLFRLEGAEGSGTRAVDVSAPSSSIGLLAGGVLTLLALVGMVWALARKPPTAQASAKEAIAHIRDTAEQHLNAGKALFAEQKYSEAKAELDQVTDLDPANLEARRLSRLAARAPDDDRTLASAMGPLATHDLKGLQRSLRLLGDLTEGSEQRKRLTAKLVSAFITVGHDACGRKGYADCAWALCRAYQYAPAEQPVDQAVLSDLRDAESHLKHDRSFTPCPFSP